MEKYNKTFPQYELGENSRWNEVDQMLYYTDIVNSAVYKMDLKSKTEKCILKTNYQIGAFLFDSKSNIVLLAKKGRLYAYKKSPAHPTTSGSNRRSQHQLLTYPVCP